MWIFILLHIVWSLIAMVVITREQRHPSSSGVWCAIVVLLPVFGTLLYILAAHSQPMPISHCLPNGKDAIENIIFSGCSTKVRRRNRVTLLHNGCNAYSALIASLQRSRRSIHMEYYIIREDRIGCSIVELLIRRARAGVEVRLIYDAVGSRALSRKMLQQMHSAGIQCVAFAPLRFPFVSGCSTRRNHRKIVVIDGAVAFLGGINIAKYYLEGNSLGAWRDEHLRIEGDAVADLQRLFISDWAKATKECLDSGRYIASHRVTSRVALQIAFSESGASRFTILDAFVWAIVRARSSVKVCSPYFIPPRAILDALRIASLAGVRVEVIIPMCSDSKLIDLVSDSYVVDLLDSGVELYRYNNGFLHAKLLLVDGDLASVGTANMDYRSLLCNLEVTAFIRDRATVRRLSENFELDKLSSLRVTPHSWRPAPYRQIGGGFLRLIAPLM